MVNEPSLSAEHREELQMVVRNIELEARLIDDLLDVTRIARGRLRLQLQKADAHQLLRHAIEIVQRSDQEREIEVAVELQAGNAGVQVDPARIQQVFWNVLRNAWKFTSPAAGSRCARRIAHRAPSPSRSPTAASGSRRRTCKRSSTPSNKWMNVAKALASASASPISKAVVDLHHGTISVASGGLGQGTTFVIELPTAAGAVIANA